MLNFKPNIESYWYMKEGKINMRKKILGNMMLVTSVAISVIGAIMVVVGLFSSDGLLVAYSELSEAAGGFLFELYCFLEKHKCIG